MSGLQHPILPGISFDLTVRTTGIKRSRDSSSIARRNNLSHRHGLKEVGSFNNGSNTVQVICSSAGTKTEAAFQDTPSGHLGSHGKRKRTNSSRILNSFIGCCGSLNMAIAEGVPNMETSIFTFHSICGSKCSYCCEIAVRVNEKVAPSFSGPETRQKLESHPRSWATMNFAMTEQQTSLWNYPKQES